LLASEGKVQSAMESELSLRKLLDEYSTKYSTLLDSLSQSNNSFERVKKDMGKMNGNLIKVEADARKWKTKVEEANKTITSISSEKAECQMELSRKDRQLAQLQELCRRLKKEQSSSETKKKIDCSSDSNFNSQIISTTDAEVQLD